MENSVLDGLEAPQQARVRALAAARQVVDEEFPDSEKLIAVAAYILDGIIPGQSTPATAPSPFVTNIPQITTFNTTAEDKAPASLDDDTGASSSSFSSAPAHSASSFRS